MPDTHQPRSGSMQFWPRKRANRPHPRIRGWAESKDAKLLGFPGYKVGMTHVMATDNRKTSMTKSLETPFPVTVIECPPIRISSIRFHKNSQISKEFQISDHKDLNRRLTKPKKNSSFEKENPDDYEDITVTVHTLPSLTGIGKKKPEIFEMRLGGSNADKLAYVKENSGKDIQASDVFEEGSIVDARAITKGHGYQGPVKRFGIGLKSHKSEKGRRRPGSLGGWKGQQHFMYRVPMAGQTGFHQRVQYTNQIMKISDKPEEVNVDGGYVNYGLVKNNYMLIRGSVPGPKKRLVVFTKGLRAPPNKLKEVPDIKYISTASKQGLFSSQYKGKNK